MATGPGFPSATDVFVPNWEASGRLAVGYARNVKDFAVNKYVQLVKSPKVRGYWMKLTAQEAARVVSTNDYVWSWAQERPLRPDGLESFNLNEFTVTRYDYGFNLDHDTIEQAEWEVAEQHAKIHAAKAMTARTINVLSAITTTSNWQTSNDADMTSNHTNTATSLAGGQFDKGTSVTPYIKIGLDKIAAQILLDTLGTVTPDKLQVIINPNQARLWAESPEIHDYIKGSPAAIDEIRTGSSPNARYGPGLPSQIYGYPILVEPTVKVTSRKGATLSKSFAFPDQQVAVVARVGELEGVYGMPSFSSVSLFWYKDEMTLERFDDPKNRRAEYHVVDAYTAVVTSPLSGYLVTSSTSVAS